VKLVFSREAADDADATDAWWRENRPHARRLFAEELEEACLKILSAPLTVRPYVERRGQVIRRWLMVRTQRHVYYHVDEEAGVVTVLRIWGARRGTGPELM
jgi:plasmid stabilization system protein ParE